MTISNDDISKFYQAFEKTIEGSNFIWNSDKLTNYVVAKALLCGVEYESDFKNLFFDVLNMPAYQDLAKQKSIFSEEFQEYVKFEYTTDSINQDLLKKQRGFDISEADIFSEYLPRKNYESTLEGKIIQGKNVLIQGMPDVGKTRLIHEVLMRIPNHYVFSFFYQYMPEMNELKFPILLEPDKVKLIWVIDNFHFFKKNLQKIYEKLIRNSKNILVVATQRSGELLPDLQLFQSMKKIMLDSWSDDELKELAKRNSIPIPKIFGTTPSTLLNEYDKLETTYSNFQVEDSNSLYVLHYLKLLSKFIEKVDYELLEKIYKTYRKGLSDKKNFETAIFKLQKNGFFEIQEGYFKYKEILFTIIISDQEYYNLKSDMENLIPLLAKLGRVRELFMLGSYYFSIKQLGLQMKCNKTIIENFERVKDYNLGICAYIDLANTLNIKGLSQKSSKDLIEACKVFEDASDYVKSLEYENEYYANIYLGWGIALRELARLTNKNNFLTEACKKFELAQKYDKDYFWIYYHWANVLADLGIFNSDPSYLHQAVDKFDLTTKYKKDYAIAYYECGIVLLELAFLNDDIQYTVASCKKFFLATEYDNKLALAYYKWGEALRNIGRFHFDLSIYQEACEKYQLAIKYKPDLSEVYYDWGLLLIIMAQISPNTELCYNDACVAFELATEYKNDYAEAYYSWGDALVCLNKYNNDTADLLEACKKFGHATKNKKDYVAAYYNWAQALTKLGNIYSDPLYCKEAFEKFEIVIMFEKDCAYAYFGLGYSMIDFHKYSNNRPDFNIINTNLLKAYLLFVSQKQWELANLIATKYLLHNNIPNFKSTYFYNITYIFDIALTILSNPENLLAIDFKNLKEVRGYVENDAIIIIIDAILEGKKPNMERDYTGDEFELEAAIFLANELLNAFPKLE